MANEFEQLRDLYLPAIEKEMRLVLGADPQDKPGDLFLGMIHYHMGWVDQDMRPVLSNSGKRIRPLLCLLACGATGGEWQQAVPAAAAIEILHNFSLAHDDIQDNSPTRRGRATLWTLWGAAQAINTGDAMFAMSHLALNRLIHHGVPAETVVRSLRRFDETAVVLTRGQYQDMSFETQTHVSPQQYLTMITGKTAVLISLCCELGALVAGVSDDQVNHLAQFGLNVGLAFQIHDDILGIWGDERLTGKSAATDIITRKKTLPVLYGLERSGDLRALYHSGPDNDTFVTAAVDLLDHVGAHQYAREQAQHYSELALTHLAEAGLSGPAGKALQQLSAQLLRRDH